MKRRSMIAALGAVFALPFARFRRKPGGVVPNKPDYPDGRYGPKALLGRVRIIDEANGIDRLAHTKILAVGYSKTTATFEYVDRRQPTKMWCRPEDEDAAWHILASQTPKRRSTDV